MIDTHQHLLYPDRFSYAWTADLSALQGQLGLEQYRAVADGLGIEGTLFMEVDVDEAHMTDEARFFCGLAEDPASGIRGVIAAARPGEPGFETHLDAIAHSRLLGVRRVLHTKDDTLAESSAFQNDVALLAKRELTFDLCALPRQLPAVIHLVRRCPEVSFVLDHCGIPDLNGGELSTWREHLSTLAGFDKVFCKISGLPAYCPSGDVSTPRIRPAVEAALQAFGWDRVLWGGDWPVCNLTSSLSQWVGIIREIVADEHRDNQHKLFSENARRIYGIPD